MRSLTRPELLALHQMERQLQICRMPQEGGYIYTINGIEVDYPTFLIAMDLMRNPQEMEASLET